MRKQERGIDSWSWTASEQICRRCLSKATRNFPEN
uniref:Uncharacterized protein n=1 Tax=Anguilla anguilla TaxID=7936 RepID=A0A0E9W8U5_ANGAN